MNKQTLNLKKITQIATEWMEKNKSHTAQAIIPIKDRMLIIALIFEGDEQKEIILNKLRTLIAEHQPKKYWIIVEGYCI